MARANTLPEYDYLTAITKSEWPEAYIRLVVDSLAESEKGSHLKIAFDEWNLRNTRGPLFVHSKGIVRRTHFHTLAMYANELQKRVADVELRAGTLTHGNASVDVVDAIATVDKSGKTWAITLTNRHPSKDVACTVKMKETPLDGTYKATLLTGDSTDAYNDIEHPDRVAPKEVKLTFKSGVANLPAHSLTIVHVPAVAGNQEET